MTARTGGRTTRGSSPVSGCRCTPGTQPAYALMPISGPAAMPSFLADAGERGPRSPA
ncbi:hypothetical protein ACWEQO_28465 [Streptomyces sp. NPDC004051]